MALTVSMAESVDEFELMNFRRSRLEEVAVSLAFPTTTPSLPGYLEMSSFLLLWQFYPVTSPRARKPGEHRM